MDFLMEFYEILPWEYSFRLWVSCISILVFPNSIHFAPWDSLPYTPVTPWVYRTSLWESLFPSCTAVMVIDGYFRLSLYFSTPVFFFPFVVPILGFLSSIMVRLYSTLDLHPGFLDVSPVVFFVPLW